MYFSGLREKKSGLREKKKLSLVILFGRDYFYMSPHEEEVSRITYYKTNFPFSSIYKRFIENSNTHATGHAYPSSRELALSSNGVFRRYINVSSESEFRNVLCKIGTEKIDLGPIYRIKLDDKCKKHINSTSKMITEAELKFDLDIDDFDEKITRTCECKTKKLICKECWWIMACSAKILQYYLDEIFGYKDFFFVFSGGRGMHCWVMDKKILTKDSSYRHAILEYFNGRFKESEKHRDYIHANFMLPLINKNATPHLKKECKNVQYDALFPKLDEQVTIKCCHLLKIPFSLHPRTGLVSVPLDPVYFEEFDPSSATIENMLIQREHLQSLMFPFV